MTVKKQTRWFVHRVLLVILDILAANLSYYLALIIRFYMGGNFKPVAIDSYIPALWRWAPWYTVAVLIVFSLFNLYRSRLSEAGLHDLNRILFANVVTALIHVAGSIVMMRNSHPKRMPISYYIMGAVIQFGFVALARFGYKWYVTEKSHLSRKARNVMLVGYGETARSLRQRMEKGEQARPVVILVPGDEKGGMIDGIPVVYDLNRVGEYVKKYKVSLVVLADSTLPREARDRIRETAGVEVQDYFSASVPGNRELSPKLLLEHITGPVVLNGVAYPEPALAMKQLGSEAVIRRIRGSIEIETENRRPQVSESVWHNEMDSDLY